MGKADLGSWPWKPKNMVPVPSHLLRKATSQEMQLEKAGFHRKTLVGTQEPLCGWRLPDSLVKV